MIKRITENFPLCPLCEASHKGQIHMRWDNERALALIPGVDQFSIISDPVHTLKLYMPLSVTCYGHDEWKEIDENPIELEQKEVLKYESNIFSALVKERLSEEADRGLMKYYHKNDSVNHKVRSFVFEAEEVRGLLMGVAVCRTQGDLTDAELELLKEYITGQASDGFGEGFEQRPIKILDGEIYVSLWSSDESWNISTWDELEQAQQMGEMKLE